MQLVCYYSLVVFTLSTKSAFEARYDIDLRNMRIVGILVAIGSDEVDLDALQVCLDDHDKKKKRCNNDNDNEDEDSTIKQQRHSCKIIINCSCEGICLEHIEYDTLI